MIRHVSVLTFVAGTSSEHIDAIEAALGQLPDRIPMRSYSFGRDVGIDSRNGTFVVVADFDDVAGYEHYRDHPDHQRVGTELIRPILSARAAVQYEVPDNG